MKERKKIRVADETFNNVKEIAEKLNISMAEVVRKSAKYISENNIDICKDIKERDDLLISLRPRLLKRFGTLAEAARQLGVTPNTISRYFSGKSKPSKSMVSKLLKVLD